jgi:hypothetical protein
MIPKPGGKDSVIGSAFQEAFPFYARLPESCIIGRIGARTELTFSVASSSFGYRLPFVDCLIFFLSFQMEFQAHIEE